ncbi:unnamed protein product [Arabidopsis lyrata]|nr:unnamed protein product [Arabidopsis lyrata]
MVIVKTKGSHGEISGGLLVAFATSGSCSVDVKGSSKDESSLLKAVTNVHAIIDKEIAGEINPENVYICGFSQGGALTLASVLLYPKALGGGSVFSGWIPFNSSIINQFTEDAKKPPIVWSHGIDDKTVLFEAGQAALPFLQQAGMTCELKV